MGGEVAGTAARSPDLGPGRVAHRAVARRDRGRAPNSESTDRPDLPRASGTGRGKGVWAVLAEVPLTQGANEVILRTWNEDGASPEKSERLVYEKPVEPKPDLIVETAEKAVVGRPTSPSSSGSAPPAP